ncbi:FAR1 DNA-binding domain [Sesbania bispinosa]|nr:FAR1 DNA-binding domain [Sesbania bispinosa]
MNVSSIPVAEGVEKWVNDIHNNIVQHGKECVVDYAPQLGMEFESEVVAYKFYNEYSKRVGFGIRREYGNKSKKDGILTSRRFSCFKEGKRSVDKRDHLTKEPRAETRTGCEAHFEACIDLHEEEGEFLNAWNDLLVDHNVSDDSWLHGIFRVKEKWAWAYVRKTFTADRASKSHETYTFLSKVCEESNKIINVMLAATSMGGESMGKCDVSISIANEKIDNNVNNIDFGGAKGIKKRDSSHKGKKRPKSWVEKLARKRKANLAQKKRKTQENLEQFVATSDGIHSFDTSHTFTQLLTQPLHCMPISQTSDHINESGSQYGSGIQVLNASQPENVRLYLNLNEADNGNQHGNTIQMTQSSQVQGALDLHNFI